MSQKGHPTSSPAGSEKLLPHPTGSSLGRPHPTRAQALLTSQGPCGTGAFCRTLRTRPHLSQPRPAPPGCVGWGDSHGCRRGGPHLGAGLWGRCGPRGGGPGGGQAAQAVLRVGAQGPVLSGTPRPWRSFRQMPESTRCWLHLQMVSLGPLSLLCVRSLRFTVQHPEVGRPLCRPGRATRVPQTYPAGQPRLHRGPIPKACCSGPGVDTPEAGRGAPLAFFRRVAPHPHPLPGV